MLWFFLRRALEAIPTLVGVAVVVFLLVRIVPGDPIAMMIAPGASEADIQALKALYGLDKSIPVQFAIWFGQAVQGDFGQSISLRQDVGTLIFARLPATLELALTALVLAVTLAFIFAVIAVYWQRHWPEVSIDLFNGLTLAIPDFVWALLLILVFGVLIPIAPISGRMDPRIAFEFATGFYFFEALLRGEFSLLGNLFAHGIMPTLALALPLAAIVTRVLKGSLQEAMVQDYVLMARAKGFGRLQIILVEALRNAIVPALTITGVQFTFLIGGTVLIEKIFAFPGIGNLAIDAVINRDLPLIQGLIITFAGLFILVNILIDFLNIVINPRLRYG